METPSRSLDAPTQIDPTSTLTQVADILNLRFTRGERKGRPNRRLVLDLIADGRLVVIDPKVSITHWTVSRAEIERYIAGIPRITDATGWPLPHVRGVA